MTGFVSNTAVEVINGRYFSKTPNMLTKFSETLKSHVDHFFIENCFLLTLSVLEHFSLKRPQLIYKNLLSLRKIKKVNSMNMCNHIIARSFKVSD